MLCPKKDCKGQLVYLGPLIGATKLYGCPECCQVYWNPGVVKAPTEKRAENPLPLTRYNYAGKAA